MQIQFSLFALLFLVVSAQAQAEKPLLPEPKTSQTFAGRTAKELRESDNALERRIGYTLKSADLPYALIPYEPNYILLSYTEDINEEPFLIGEDRFDREAEEFELWETKYQISLMAPLWRQIFKTRMTLIGSYTQLSFWQTFNSDISEPFRESNYEPQLFLNWITNKKLIGLHWNWIEAGFNHQSNGRPEGPENVSRSWNRIYGNFIGTRGNFVFGFRPWLVVGDDDDNPDIEDFLGYYDLQAGYRYKSNVFTGRGHMTWEGKGALEVNWSYPLTRNLRLYGQIFTGYGESLIDYDHEQTRIGFGLALNDSL